MGPMVSAGDSCATEIVDTTRVVISGTKNEIVSESEAEPEHRIACDFPYAECRAERYPLFDNVLASAYKHLTKNGV